MKGRTNEAETRRRLLREGRRIFRDPPRGPIFTQDRDAERLLTDLDRHPHAFVLACIMDRQMRAELAWVIPQRIAEKIGGFSMRKLERLSLQEVRRLMSKPRSLHRFAREMARNFHAGVGRIAEQYEGDASRIWSDRPSSATVVCRFLEFRGVGPKIATMATNILARHFKIPLSDYYSVDVSADIHVRRVFTRLGLCRRKASVEEVIYCARDLHPEFPGLMDLPAWKIGREWCRPREPLCPECFMRDVCPSAKGLGLRVDGSDPDDQDE